MCDQQPIRNKLVASNQQGTSYRTKLCNKEIMNKLMNNIAITIDPYLEQLVQHQACSYAIYVQQGSQSIITNPIVFYQANASRICVLKLELF